MNRNTFNLTVTETKAVCPVGETVGRKNASSGAIPVLSCEGPCIRGEIARLAAHRLAKEPGFGRACHGELIAVPDSAMAHWVKQAPTVVVVDGCHLKCHARIVEHLVPRARLRSFDALGHYRRYSDLFDYDAVPEPERQAVAEDVAAWVLRRLRAPSDAGEAESSGCCPAQPSPSSCGGE